VPLATDGQDENGVQLENVQRAFSIPEVVSCKKSSKTYYGLLSLYSLDIFLLMFQEYFVCDQRHFEVF